jgi:calcineurin-like phosphoesterase family protein
MTNIWFTSDLHFSHKNILRHCEERLKAFGIPSNISEEEKVRLHDKYLIKLWNKTVSKKDIIYVLGDFSFANTENTKKILSKLNGNKFLILGNHDKSSEKLEGYFKQIAQMKEIIFKKDNFDFLEEDFGVFCCHYAMITWSRKHYGVCQLMGHSHGRMDDYNEASTDLRVDVGIDGKLAKFNFISLEQLYKYFKDKINKKLFVEYTQEMKSGNSMII